MTSTGPAAANAARTDVGSSASRATPVTLSCQPKPASLPSRWRRLPEFALIPRLRLLGCCAVGRDFDLCGGLDERQQLLVQAGCELFASFGRDGHRETLGHDGGAEFGSVVRR